MVGTVYTKLFSPGTHLHHSVRAGAGTNTVPNLQEIDVPGGDMGASTALYLPDMKHRSDPRATQDLKDNCLSLQIKTDTSD